MDIKLKNRKVHILLSILCLYLMSFSVISTLDVSRNRNYLRKDPYFNSRNYAHRLQYYAQNVITFEGIDIVDINEEKKEELIEAAKKNLSSYKSIKYYIVDKKNEKVFTNIDNLYNIDDYVNKNSLYSEEFPREYINDINLYNLEQINQSFKYHNLEGTFIVLNDPSVYDQIIEDNNYYNSKRSRLIKEIIMAFISLILCVGIYISFVSNKDEHLFFIKKLRKRYEKIPIDIRIIILLVSVFIMYDYIKYMNFFYWPMNAGHFGRLTLVALYISYFILNVDIAFQIISDREVFKKHFEKSVAYRFVKLFIDSFMAKGIMGKVILSIIFTMICGVAFLSVIIGFLNGSETIGILAILYIAFYFFIVFLGILRKIVYINKIVIATDEIVEGNLDYIIEEKGNSKLTVLARNINNMKDGFKKSVESQVKSERMKSELITNVSHDLKTPLTSIINYVNILKNEDLSLDEQKSYIEILDRKSQRLKTLIEDLFEASKMSSESVDLDIEKIDIVSLLRQTLGEFDEKISNSSLIFKVDCPDKKMYADLDGKKTWRVFENLIGNILKYSMDNTRVYIKLTETKEYIIISMKNISSYEMDFSADEIFERFKRGDKSRNTDGSGLGLAIAKSIVELQHGKMYIDIDGDLFKVTVAFRKSEDEVQGEVYE